jgi:endo-1,4-beta-xylanase
MNKSILSFFVASVLVYGCVFLVPAAESTTQTQPAVSSTTSADAVKLPFETPLQWKSTGILVKPVSDDTHTIVSVKDPTVVRYNDLWHVFATVYSTSAKRGAGVS